MNQTNFKKMNMNDSIWVHVTDAGWNHLFERDKKYLPKGIDTVEKYKDTLHKSRRNIDGKEYTEFIMWEFFSGFDMRFGGIEDRFSLNFYIEEDGGCPSESA